MYYLDKQFKGHYMEGYVSYEAGPYDDMYFNTYEEAETYACENAYRIDEDEALLICREEEEL